MTATVSFDLDLAKRCQSGEVKGCVYSTDLLVRHNLCSNITTIGDRFYVAFFRDEVEGEYPLTFDKNGIVPNSKFRVLIDICKEQKFNPFDKVLVRDHDKDIWRARIYDYYAGSYHFCQDGHGYNYCIPYEGNEQLACTTNKQKEE